MADEELVLRTRLDDQASAGLQNMQNQMKALGQPFQDVGQRVSAFGQEVVHGLGGALRATESGLSRLLGQAKQLEQIKVPDVGGQIKASSDAGIHRLDALAASLKRANTDLEKMAVLLQDVEAGVELKGADKSALLRFSKSVQSGAVDLMHYQKVLEGLPPLGTKFQAGTEAASIQMMKFGASLRGVDLDFAKMQKQIEEFHTKNAAGNEKEKRGIYEKTGHYRNFFSELKDLNTMGEKLSYTVGYGLSRSFSVAGVAVGALAAAVAKVDFTGLAKESVKNAQTAIELGNNSAQMIKNIGVFTGAGFSKEDALATMRGAGEAARDIRQPSSRRIAELKSQASPGEQPFIDQLQKDIQTAKTPEQEAEVFRKFQKQTREWMTREFGPREAQRAIERQGQVLGIGTKLVDTTLPFETATKEDIEFFEKRNEAMKKYLAELDKITIANKETKDAADSALTKLIDDLMGWAEFREMSERAKHLAEDIEKKQREGKATAVDHAKLAMLQILQVIQEGVKDIPLVGTVLRPKDASVAIATMVENLRKKILHQEGQTVRQQTPEEVEIGAGQTIALEMLNTMGVHQPGTSLPEGPVGPAKVPPGYKPYTEPTLVVPHKRDAGFDVPATYKTPGPPPPAPPPQESMLDFIQRNSPFLSSFIGLGKAVKWGAGQLVGSAGASELPPEQRGAAPPATFAERWPETPPASVATVVAPIVADVVRDVVPQVVEAVQPEESKPGIASAATDAVIKILEGIWETVKIPGKAYAGEYAVQPTTPGMWSEDDEFRAQLAARREVLDALRMGGYAIQATAPSGIVQTLRNLIPESLPGTIAKQAVKPAEATEVKPVEATAWKPVEVPVTTRQYTPEEMSDFIDMLIRSVPPVTATGQRTLGQDAGLDDIGGGDRGTAPAQFLGDYYSTNIDDRRGAALASLTEVRRGEQIEEQTREMEKLTDELKRLNDWLAAAAAEAEKAGGAAGGAGAGKGGRARVLSTLGLPAGINLGGAAGGAAGGAGAGAGIGGPAVGPAAGPGIGGPAAEPGAGPAGPATGPAAGPGIGGPGAGPPGIGGPGAGPGAGPPPITATEPGQPGGPQTGPAPGGGIGEPATPGAGGTGAVGGLAGMRAGFAKELQDPALRQRFFALSEAEIGGQGQQARQAFMETVMNRAASRKMSLAQAMNDKSYFPGTTQAKLGRTFGGKQLAEMESTLGTVAGGSDLTAGGTGNYSVDKRRGWGPGVVGQPAAGLGGGPVTYKTGRGEYIGMEQADINKGWRQRYEQAKQAGTPTAPAGGEGPVATPGAPVPQGTGSLGPVAAHEYARRKGEPGEFNAARTGEFGPPGVAANQTKVKLANGQTITVNKAVAERYKGFFNEMIARGYPVDASAGGYSNRQNVNDPSKVSMHAYGTAVDINVKDNPNKGRTTNFRADEVEQTAWKHGLSWGGRFGDPMHFEAMGQKAWDSKLKQLGMPRGPTSPTTPDLTTDTAPQPQGTPQPASPRTGGAAPPSAPGMSGMPGAGVPMRMPGGFGGMGGFNPMQMLGGMGGGNPLQMLMGGMGGGPMGMLQMLFGNLFGGMGGGNPLQMFGGMGAGAPRQSGNQTVATRARAQARERVTPSDEAVPLPRERPGSVGPFAPGIGSPGSNAVTGWPLGDVPTQSDTRAPMLAEPIGGGMGAGAALDRSAIDRARQSVDVNGTGKLSVDVRAPPGTRVAAEGGGLFKTTELTRMNTQMEPASQGPNALFEA